jgi:hypothetical protein
MTVEQLADLINKVCGLSINWAKVCIYYAMATHRIDNYTWFAVLCFIGPPGTGKSKSLDIMAKVCNKPFRITCHATMTPATLRDELVSSKTRVTAIIEEADLYPNRKQLQGYIINRVDRVRTSGLAVKEQVETDTGVKDWRTHHKKTYGATVVHDRNSLDDLAAESRAIIINTTYKEGNYIDPPDKLSLPVIKTGLVPSYFSTGSRAFDTWKPLLEMASGQNDDDWLVWACEQVQEATDGLRDGHAYEEKQAIFAQVIKAYCENSGFGLVVKPDEGLILQHSVFEPLKKEMPYITPRTVASVLTKMGLKVIRHSGTNKLFTSVDELKRVARDIGYQDEVLK